MQALREIHTIMGNSLTIQIPQYFKQQVEVIVLPLEKELPIKTWKTAHNIFNQLNQSNQQFSDSAELLREERDK